MTPQISHWALSPFQGRRGGNGTLSLHRSAFLFSRFLPVDPKSALRSSREERLRASLGRAHRLGLLDPELASRRARGQVLAPPRREPARSVCSGHGQSRSQRGDPHELDNDATEEKKTCRQGIPTAGLISLFFVLRTRSDLELGENLSRNLHHGLTELADLDRRLGLALDFSVPHRAAQQRFDHDLVERPVFVQRNADRA